MYSCTQVLLKERSTRVEVEVLFSFVPVFVSLLLAVPRTVIGTPFSVSLLLFFCLLFKHLFLPFHFEYTDKDSAVIR